jgi:hypothetical protein
MQEDKDETDNGIVSTSTLAMMVPYTRSPTVKLPGSLQDDREPIHEDHENNNSIR